MNFTWTIQDYEGLISFRVQMFTVDRDFDRQSFPCRCYSIGCASDFGRDYGSGVWTASGCSSYTNRSCRLGDPPPGNLSRYVPRASWTRHICTCPPWTSFLAEDFLSCFSSFFASFLCPFPCPDQLWLCLRPSPSCDLCDLLFAAILRGHVVAFASFVYLVPRAPRCALCTACQDPYSGCNNHGPSSRYRSPSHVSRQRISAKKAFLI